MRVCPSCPCVLYTLYVCVFLVQWSHQTAMEPSPACHIVDVTFQRFRSVLTTFKALYHKRLEEIKRDADKLLHARRFLQVYLPLYLHPRPHWPIPALCCRARYPRCLA